LYSRHRQRILSEAHRPPIKLGALSFEAKRPGHLADHSPSSNAEV
jgi:hypothetical protein